MEIANLSITIALQQSTSKIGIYLVYCFTQGFIFIVHVLAYAPWIRFCCYQTIQITWEIYIYKKCQYRWQFVLPEKNKIIPKNKNKLKFTLEKWFPVNLATNCRQFTVKIKKNRWKKKRKFDHKI